VTQVWIVLETYEYEGESVVGVFASEAAADAEAARLFDPDHPSHVSYRVRAFDVNESLHVPQTPTTGVNALLGALPDVPEDHE
jgi:hypothetical protein